MTCTVLNADSLQNSCVDTYVYICQSPVVPQWFQVETFDNACDQCVQRDILCLVD